ncbi:MAG TPA: HAD-IC family P-type ATPase, partial [Thermoanaerobaculia bacterium]|nr:HAD-IC family P-type ATPase [Thermoanaerobaculia bacterium]
TGEMRVASVDSPDLSRETMLAVAAALEEGSEHPIGRAIRDAWEGDLLPITGFRAVPGQGVLATVVLDGRPRQARLGNADFVGGAPGDVEPGTTQVHLALDGEWQGTITLRDSLRSSTREAVADLQSRGLAMEVLSGDAPASVAAFAADLPGLAAEGGLSPEAKLDRVRAAARDGKHPVMVGDGINDAPALSSAAVAVTLASGTDLAREVADITLLGGDLRRLPWLIALSERTLRTAKTNLLWSFGYNTVGMGLAVAGLLHPLFGAVGMVGSSLLVVLRSQRLARVKL